MIPQISIVVPIYKVEKYLSECIDSILSQSFSNFELLLIDDGSPDNCGVICDEYAKKDNRIKVFHQPNGGASKARNLGIKKACAHWITFIDADDLINKSFLENLYQPTTQLPIDFVHAGCLKFNEDKKFSIEQSYEYYKGNDPIYLINNIRGLTFSKLYKLDIILKNNIFYNEKIKYAEDMIFTLDYIKHVNFYVFSSSTEYLYRIHSESAMHANIIPSYETCYNSFIYFYHAIISYANKYNIKQNEIKLRFNQAGTHLNTALTSLFHNKYKHSERIKHYKNDFTNIDFSLIKFNELPIFKRILLTLFINRHFYLYDFLTEKLFLIKNIKKDKQ